MHWWAVMQIRFGMYTLVRITNENYTRHARVRIARIVSDSGSWFTVPVGVCSSRRHSRVPDETSRYPWRWLSARCRCVSRSTARRCWRWKRPRGDWARPGPTWPSRRHLYSTNANTLTEYRNRDGSISGHLYKMMIMIRQVGHSLRVGS